MAEKTPPATLGWLYGGVQASSPPAWESREIRFKGDRAGLGAFQSARFFSVFCRIESKIPNLCHNGVKSTTMSQLGINFLNQILIKFIPIRIPPLLIQDILFKLKVLYLVFFKFLRSGKKMRGLSRCSV
jgi:hypothetical protein